MFVCSFVCFAGFGKASNTRIRAEKRIRKWLGRGDCLVSKASFILRACNILKNLSYAPKQGAITSLIKASGIEAKLLLQLLKCSRT